MNMITVSLTPADAMRVRFALNQKADAAIKAGGNKRLENARKLKDLAGQFLPLDTK